MGQVSQVDIEKAERQAAACHDARAQIDQAGRGLALAMASCTAGAADAKTIVILAAVAAYVADALRILVEKDMQQEAASQILVPR